MNHQRSRSPRLPELLLITPEPPPENEFPRFLQDLANTLETGIQLVQLRSKTLDALSFSRLADAVGTLCHAYDARLIVNGPDLDSRKPADGIHLSSAKLDALDPATIVGRQQLVSASCHNRNQLLQAQRAGLDFVLLSPVRPTRSHPGYPALGWDAFAALIRGIALPVYALGGLNKADLGHAQAHGAYGIAAITGLWRPLV